MAEDLRLNCGEVPSSISERNAQVLKVYVIQRGQNIKANVVRLERLSIPTHRRGADATDEQ